MEVWTREELARAVGVEVRTIREWQAQRLLPEPQRMATGRKGQPPLAWQRDGRKAAQALALWRKYVSGGHDARVWLYLEGFDYAQPDLYRLRTLVERWATAQWEQLTRPLGLPDGITVKHDLDIHLSDSDQEAAKDALDTAYVGRLSEANARQGLASLLILLVGFDGQDVLDTATDGMEQEHREALPVSTAEAVRTTLAVLAGAGVPAVPDLTGMPNPSSLRQIAGTLLDGVQRTLGEQKPAIDWPAVRRRWQQLCANTDARLNADPITDIPCYLRRLAYRHDPRATILLLARIDQVPALGFFWKLLLLDEQPPMHRQTTESKAKRWVRTPGGQAWVPEADAPEDWPSQEEAPTTMA